VINMTLFFCCSIAWFLLLQKWAPMQ
jgi:hypothetical protein